MDELEKLRRECEDAQQRLETTEGEHERCSRILEKIRIIRRRGAGDSITQIAEKLDTSYQRVYKQYVSRVIKAYEAEGIDGIKRTRGRQKDEYDNEEIRAPLRQLREEYPEATQNELSSLLLQHYQIKLSPPRVGHYLRRDGLTRKKGKHQS